MKKINIFILIGIGVIIIVSGWIFFSNKIGQPIFQAEVKIPQENIKKGIVLVIDDGEVTPKTFKSEFKEGVTAFDLLKKKTEELNMVLKTKTYDTGILIETIGNKENGQDGKYWMYYVNGEMPMIAAGRQELKPGDKVEFKFEKSPF